MKKKVLYKLLMPEEENSNLTKTDFIKNMNILKIIF